MSLFKQNRTKNISLALLTLFVLSACSEAKSRRDDAPTAPKNTSEPVVQGEPTEVVEAPVVEAPVVEAPVVEAPVVEAPVVEAPVVEAPVVEAPMVEAPVVEAPMVEAPVPEQSDARSFSLTDLFSDPESQADSALSLQEVEKLELEIAATTVALDQLEDELKNAQNNEDFYNTLSGLSAITAFSGVGYALLFQNEIYRGAIEKRLEMMVYKGLLYSRSKMLPFGADVKTLSERLANLERQEIGKLMSAVDKNEKMRNWIQSQLKQGEKFDALIEIDKTRLDKLERAFVNTNNPRHEVRILQKIDELTKSMARLADDRAAALKGEFDRFVKNLIAEKKEEIVKPLRALNARNLAEIQKKSAAEAKRFSRLPRHSGKAILVAASVSAVVSIFAFLKEEEVNSSLDELQEKIWPVIIERRQELERQEAALALRKLDFNQANEEANEELEAEMLNSEVEVEIESIIDQALNDVENN